MGHHCLALFKWVRSGTHHIFIWNSQFEDSRNSAESNRLFVRIIWYISCNISVWQEFVWRVRKSRLTRDKAKFFIICYSDEYQLSKNTAFLLKRLFSGTIFLTEKLLFESQKCCSKKQNSSIVTVWLKTCKWCRKYWKKERFSISFFQKRLLLQESRNSSLFWVSYSVPWIVTVTSFLKRLISRSLPQKYVQYYIEIPFFFLKKFENSTSCSPKIKPNNIERNNWL